ncbi:MAG: redoxin domain-containing protein [Deltaproteobacteria bacterium]|nr:redoxin domain-containing protein [Deltaproteobacteria bacterium]
MNQEVGKPFPDLELLNHEGHPVKLSDVAGKFPLIAVFYRGYW